MKATGMVRRIDELGRVVIPKEIRRTMRIREGEELEIFTNEGDELVIKKYSRMKGLEEVGSEYCVAVCDATQGTVLLTDGEKIVAGSGRYKKEYINKPLSKEMIKAIERRKAEIYDNSSLVGVIDGDNKIFLSQYVKPIISGGDLYGAFIVLLDERVVKESVVKVTDTATRFLLIGLE